MVQGLIGRTSREGNGTRQMMAGIILSIVALLLAAVTSAHAATVWTGETVDQGRDFVNFKQANSIALETTNQIPHIAYGGKGLYHAWLDGFGWHTETIFSGADITSAAIVLDSANKVHIVCFDAAGGGLHYVTNTSGSWQKLALDAAAVGDFSLAIDSANRLVLSYAAVVGGEQVLRFGQKPFLSPTWTTETVDAQPGLQLGAQNSIAVDSSHQVHISYRDSSNHTLKYANNIGGWHTSTLGDPGDTGYYSAITVGIDDRIHIGYYEAGTKQLRYATAPAGTGPWTFAGVTTAAAHQLAGRTSIGIDYNGKVHIVFADTTSKLFHTTNISGTWVEETVLDGSADSSVNSSTAAVISPIFDTIHVTNAKAKLTYLIMPANSSNAWSPTAVDAGGDVGLNPALMINGSVPEIFYGAAGTRQAVRLGTNQWNIGAFFPLLTVSAAGRDAGNNLHMVFNDNGKIAYASSPGFDPVHVDEVGGNLPPVMALDNSGRPRLAFSRMVDGFYNLIYASSNGTVWFVETADGSPGMLAGAIAVDNGGFAHISYYDQVQQALKHATNASGSWQSVIVDQGGNVGQYSSIAIDGNGAVHIGYSEQSQSNNRQLKYATNASGSWVTETVLSGLADRDVETSLTLDGNGIVHLAFVAGTTLGHTMKTGGSWVTTYPASGLSGTAQPVVRVDAGSTTHIAFHDSTNYTLRYAFAPAAQLTVTKDGDGSGTVTADTGTINWIYGNAGEALYPSGTMITLTATPDPGFKFMGWSGACSGTGSCTVTMDQAQNVGATFAFAIDGICGDSTIGPHIAPPVDNFCTAGIPTAVTGPGPWQWSCMGEGLGSTATCTANVQTYAVTFSAVPGNGTLSGTVSQTVNHGASATPVRAIPADGYQFLNWSGSGGFVNSAANPLTVQNVVANMDIVATFAPARIDGNCGTANGGTVAEAPTASLCASGAPSRVYGSGPWGWSCGGQFGGATALCSAASTGSGGPISLDNTFTPSATGGTVYSLAVLNDGKILASAGNRLYRLNGDGSVDSTFNFTAENTILAAVPLAGGMTLVGGNMSSIVRLDANGQPTPDFYSLNFNGYVNVLLPLPDGRIMVGGSTTLANIARLNPDGSPDFSFQTTADGEVTSILLQPDGKILMGGTFTIVNGRQISGIARLNQDGSLDNSFTPSAAVQTGVMSLALQADGKILVSGGFNSVYRLNSDGSLDQSFAVTVQASGPQPVKSLAIQGNGRILISGEFTGINGVPRAGLARLTPTGALDAAFDLPVTNGPLGIMAMALQPNGWILLGGDFTAISGTTLPGLARITDVASLDAAFAVADDGSSVALLSGSTGPAFKEVLFEGSADGSTWTPLGPSVAIPEGWQASAAIPVQQNYYVRVTGSMPSGSYTASTSLLQGSGTVFLPQSSTSYTVTPSVNGSGSILAAVPITAVGGSVVAFDTFADTGFHLVAAGGTCGAIVQGTRIATPPLSADCTVQAIFEPILLPVTPTVSLGGGGTIAPAAVQQVSYGSTATFTVTPDGDNRVSTVTGCGGIWSGPETGGSFVTGPIQVPCTVTATFLTAYTPAIQVQTMAFQPDGKLLMGAIDGQLERFTATGWHDSGFANIMLQGGVNTLAVQGNGRFMAGGKFGESLVGLDFSPAFLAGFVSDGLLDTLFRPYLQGPVSGIALPSDRLLVTGGTPGYNSFVTELNQAYAFQAAPGPGDNFLTSVLLRDGKVLVGGLFNQINGMPRGNIARLDSSGALDVAYNPGADGQINVMVLQRDGKVLLGGDFLTIGGQSQPYLARLNADGSLDQDFFPVVDAPVQTITLQADGKIILSGTFTAINGQQRHYLARLNQDGTLDTGFDPAPNSTITAVALRQDGSLLASGSFSTIAGIYHPSFAQLAPDALVTETLAAAQDGTSLALLRSGPGPEFQSVIFEVSPDNSTWSYLGSGVPIGGGWQLTGLALATGQNYWIRARGGAPSNGTAGSSWSLYETVQQVTLPASPASFTVTVTVAGSGTADKTGDLTVGASTVANINLYPGTGAHVATVGGTCGGILLGQQTFSTAPVTADCTVTVQFANNVYPVTFTAGAHGTLLGTTSQMVVHGSDTTAVEAVADSHYHFVNWTGGTFTSSVNPLTIGAVTSRLNLTANFAIDTFAVTPAAGANGAVYPAIPQQVGYGSVFSFRPLPESGFAFSGVTGDCPAGSYNPATGIYSTGTITAACSITATFAPSTADNTVALVSWGSRVLDARMTGPFKAIGAGVANTIGVLANGSVTAWGDNSYGQSGPPAALGGVVTVTGGQAFGLALKDDGTVTGWGSGSGGSVPQLSQVTAISAHSFHALALRQDGTVVVWGGDEWPSFPLSGGNGATNVRGIAAGGFFSALLSTTGTVTSYIGTEQGELTDVAGADKIAAGLCHVLALMPDGTVRVTPVAAPDFWLQFGAVGICNEAAFAGPPPNLTNVTAIAAGDGHNVALKGDGTVVAWGANTAGQCNVPAGLVNVVAIAANGNFTVALKADGTIVSWGDNSKGQSLDLSRMNRLKTASSGTGHALAIDAAGTLLTWGENTAGQVANNGLTDVVAVAGGYAHSLALRKDGTLQAWGDNSAGQTAVPTMAPVVSVAAAASQSLALTSTGTVAAWGLIPAPPADLSGVVAIAAGDLHALALKSDGTVVAWGDNSFGQSTVPAGLGGVKAIAAATGSSLALKTDGTLVTWGAGSAPPPGLTDVVAIASGPDHFLATRSDNSVVAWGAQTVVPAGVAGVVTQSGGSYSQVLAPKFTVALSVATGHGHTTPEPTVSASAGIRVPITLVPDTGYHVDKVEGSCGGTLNGTTFTTNPLQADCTVVASYAINTYLVTFIVEGNGSLQGTLSQTVTHGQAATAVQALPGIGHHFVDWSGTGGFASTDNPLTVASVTGPMTITAHFAINIYTVTFVEGANGTISGTKVQQVAHGSNATAVTAVPDAVYQFDYWSGTGGFVDSPNNPLQVANVTGNMTITANFTQRLVRVTPWMTGGGLMFPTAVQEVVQGNVATFMLFPASGYTFDNAAGTCPIGSYDAVNHIYATGALTGNCTVIINFKQTVTNPVITAFTAPATVTGLTVPISSLLVADGTTVTGYLITQSATPPLATDPGWLVQAPGSFMLPTAQSTTLYAWAKNAAGTVSNTLSAPVQLLLARCLGSNQYYQSIQQAYNAASDTETVQVLQLGANVSIAGDLNLDRNVAVTFKGGLADGYGAQAGSTTISGALTITAGSMVVDGLVIQ